MKRTTVLVWLIALIIAVTACSSPTSSDEGDGPWSTPGGLTIGYIPEGYAWVWNEGHETATFHVFESADGLDRLAVGRQISPEPNPLSGEEVIRDARVFTLVEDTSGTSVSEDAGDDIRIEVVSSSLDSETLLRIAESVSFDPNQDQ